MLEHYGADGNTLPASGGWAPVLCPFHPDTVKSAGIHPDWNAFHCHGCGVSGDSWKIIMEQEGVSFADAIGFAVTELGFEGGDVRRPAIRRRPYKPSWS